MIPPDDSHRDDAGSSDSDAGPGVPTDFDAAFRAIVENYGERPTLGAPVEPAPEPEPAAVEEPVVDPRLFDTGHLEPTLPVAPREEEHFVPPAPPPVPRATPTRRLAWLGLFVAPMLMLAAVVFGWAYPEWVSLLLVAGFVGGFVFLVATMPGDRGDNDGDGAVV